MLARRRGLRFVDVDDVVVEQAGMDVAAIFAAEGEVGFRRRERAALDRLAGVEQVVLALGGGAVGAGLPAFAAWPRVVLMASSATLRARVLTDPRARPLLMGEGLDARIATLLALRADGWRAFGVSVQTDERTVDEVAHRVEWLW